ncbi:hypothetical protein KEM54_000579 [Ascosphaera aggregata]|nr:hypothetical protein KEM54_000579 [Ascosphaera aggregata]
MVTSSPASPSPGKGEGESASIRSTPASAKSPVIVTPGRKIRELMAQFDSEEDEDDSEDGEQSEKVPAVNKDATVLKPQISGKSTGASRFKLSITQSSDEDDDEDDEDMFRPRGRLAARLLTYGDNRSSFLERHLTNVGADDDGSNEAQEPAEERDTTPIFPTNAARLGAPSINDYPQSAGLFVGQDSEESISGLPYFKGAPHDRSESTRPNPPFQKTVIREKPRREEHDDEQGKRPENARRSFGGASIASGSESGADEGTEDVETILTQHSKPTKRASKAAIEEMNRQTQRMSRSMQLAHSAITKKKLTLGSFISRFNQNTSAKKEEDAPADFVQDAVDNRTHSNSFAMAPPEDINNQTGGDISNATTSNGVDSEIVEDGNDELDKLPGLDHKTNDFDSTTITAEPQKTISANKQTPLRSKHNLRVNLSKERVKEQQEMSQDDDLEIITDSAQARRIAIFENMPIRKRQQDIELSTSIQRLRALAQVSSQTHRSSQSTQSMKQLELDLWRRAREQAYSEREERINALRARGIVIESADERSKFEEDIEDLLDKARLEAKEIRRREKEKKKEGDVGDDEDEDEDYVEIEDDEEEEEGEDEEDEGKGVQGVEGGRESDNNETGETEREDASATAWTQVAKADNGFHEQRHADGGDADETSIHEVLPSEETTESKVTTQPDNEDAYLQSQRPRRTTYTVHDDDDDDNNDDNDGNGEIVTNTGTNEQNTRTSPSEKANEREAVNPFDIGISNQETSELSLSQAFADTLAKSQFPGSAQLEQSVSDIDVKIGDVDAPPKHSDVPHPLAIESPVIKPLNDQSNGSPRHPLYIHTSPAVDLNSESPAGKSVSKFSIAPTPTQDKGFVYSPFQSRKLSIQSSMLTEQSAARHAGHSPGPTGGQGFKKSLLRRGLKERQPEQNGKGTGDYYISKNVFDVMKKRAKDKRKRPQFNRERSEAKEMLDEVAEESDDEYAGLGGRSDDSEGEEEEDDRKMINDDDNTPVDGAELAALNADHIRTRDEAAVQKLFQDITTGALRRKRGRDGNNDVDLSDSDDERYAARRRAKRREYAEMRRALLLADKKIGRIAEDPKKVAFLKTLEENNLEDTDASLDVDQEWDGTDYSGNSRGSSTAPTSDERDRTPAEGLQKPRLRDAYAKRKPLSHIDVKNTVSSLLGEPDTPSDVLPDDDFDEAEMIPPNNEERNGDSGSDDELAAQTIDVADSNENTGSHKPIEPTREMLSHSKYVNRWSLRRTASINAAVSLSKPVYSKESKVPSSPRILPPGGRRISTLAPDSQKTTTVTTTTTHHNRSTTAVNGGEHASTNYYAATRKRQRESELQHAARTPNKPQKLTAAIAAARSGGGLQRWVGDKGFES